MSTEKIFLAQRRSTPPASAALIKTAKDFVRWILPLTQNRVQVIGFDTEYAVPTTVPLKGSGKDWQDFTDLRPIVLSLCANIHVDGELRKHACCVFVWKGGEDPQLIPTLGAFFRQPFVFACHWQRAEYSALDCLGLRRPQYVYDTYLAERVLTLGLNNFGKDETSRGRPDEWDGTDDSNDKGHDGGLKLLNLCTRYGITHGHSEGKQDLVLRFASWTDQNVLGQEEVRYAIEDARVCADIYPLQLREMIDSGSIYPYISMYGPAASLLTEMS
ncbi:MAG: hypothetical protein HQL31_01315 [Planctomycetes bacterium]|nr:hypothetical protein [Planctomycetota bacterium]